MPKDRTVMRADLRLDLKDSGALWSDAELNRCVEKAISDLSRFLPRERVYEEELEFDVTSEAVTFPKTTSATYIVNAQTFNGKTAGNTFTIAAQPDVPRVVTLLITDADNSITDWHIRIHGTDEESLGCTEDFYFSRGKTQTGVQVFKRIDSVELVENFGGSAAAGDTLSLGIGAYYDTWVSMAYKPVKNGSETLTEAGGTVCARNTDFLIDYMRGKLKAISGGKIAAEEACTITYRKDQTSLDLTLLDDFIRVFRVEYPAGEIPQSFCTFDLYGRFLTITGRGESTEQQSMSEGKQVRVYYEAAHHPPTDYAPGSIPEFLENTVIMAAGAYALFVYSLKCTHQALTDLTTARAAIAAAESAQAGLAAILTAISAATTAGSTALAGIDAIATAGAAALASVASYTGDVETALNAANAYLDAVAEDLTAADTVAASYIGATNYVAGGSAQPDIKKSIVDGAALINTITEGGENERTPEIYATYATAIKNALVAAFEQHRSFYQQDATARTNAALGFVQEASQRVSLIRSLVEEGNAYAAIGQVLANEGDAYATIGQVLVGKANALLSQLAAYLQEATASTEAAAGDLTMADKFRTEGINRRDEVWSIWRDRKEYIGDFSSSAMNQSA